MGSFSRWTGNPKRRTLSNVATRQAVRRTQQCEQQSRHGVQENEHQEISEEKTAAATQTSKVSFLDVIKEGDVVMTENDVQGVDQEAKDVVDDFTKIASTVNTVIQLLSILYRTLDDTKILEDLGNLYQKAYRAMSKAHTDMDVYAYEEYIGAGMSSRQASELLLARTATSGLKLNTKIWDNTVFGKKKEEK